LRDWLKVIFTEIQRRSRGDGYDKTIITNNRLDIYNTTKEELEILKNLNQNVSKDLLDRLAEEKVKELRKKS